MRKGTYRIDVEILLRGSETILVKGYGIGLLAATPLVVSGKPSRREWKISHVPTGASVGSVTRSQKDTLALISKLTGIADWNFSTPTDKPRLKSCYDAMVSHGLWKSVSHRL